MQWSPEQDLALKKIDHWFKNETDSKQVFRLFGYAGTGKTTLAKTIAQNIEGDVKFAAFTGKAAYVLQQKGCEDASTIHQLIYHPKDKSKMRLSDLETELAEALLNGDEKKAVSLRREIEVEKDNLSRPAFVVNHESIIRHSSLLIIDECSMVDGRIGEDLLSFGIPILVLGDPAQLPPVAGAGFFTNTKPDILLTEIHRQAKENPIIAMATEVRNGKTLSLGSYGGSRVIEKKDLIPDNVLSADQVLVGRNLTRQKINNRFRELIGYEGKYPVVGDKIICLKNNHEYGLLNGGMWDVLDVGEISTDSVYMSIESRDMLDKYSLEVEAHLAPFFGEKVSVWLRNEAQEFDFGYSITVHKSQGSQWDNIILFDEWFSQGRKEWLYTAITRAAENITIVR